MQPRLREGAGTHHVRHPPGGRGLLTWPGGQAQYRGLLRLHWGYSALPDKQTQLLASFLPFLPLQNTVTVGGSFLLLLVQLPKAKPATGPSASCTSSCQASPCMQPHRAPPEPPPPHANLQHLQVVGLYVAGIPAGAGSVFFSLWKGAGCWPSPAGGGSAASSTPWCHHHGVGAPCTARLPGHGHGRGNGAA